MLLDVNAIQEKARAELAKEVTEEAVTKLKELFTKKAKAEQIVKNIDREIAGYMANIEENAVYQAAGVNTKD